MPNYSSVGKKDSMVDRYNRTNNIVTIPMIPKQVIQRIIIIMDSYSSKTSIDFLKMLIASNSVLNGVMLYNGPCKKTSIGNIKINSLADLLQFFYNKGYRMFITNNYSSDLFPAFNWIRTRDVILFNTFSTVATDEFLNNIPDNIVRTSVNDLEMLNYLFEKVLTNFYKYLNEMGNESIALPLSKSESGVNPFSVVVYIYEPSLYASGYLLNLEKVLYDNTDIELVSIKLENGVLPDLAKYYLTYNNISSPNYINSTNKPLIIFNSEEPDSLFSYLDDEKYFDNYTFFGDVFSTDIYNTAYPFTAAFVNISNFSDIGFRFSYLVDKDQSISPQTLNIYNILSQCGSLFMSVAKQSRFQFNVRGFLNLLNSLFVVTNGDWTEKYVNVYKYLSSAIVDSPLFENKFELLCSYHQWNPTAVVVYSSSSTILNYNHIVINGELSTYLKNVQRIEKNKPNIDELLDNTAEYFISQSNVAMYNNFLDSNYKNRLTEYMFTQYYVYKSVKKYKIPIITPPPIQISKTISKDKYVIPVGTTNQSLNIPVQVPSIAYDTKVYYYDITKGKLINILTDNYTEELYDTIEFELEDSSPTVILHLYKGHLFNLGKYNEVTGVFTTTEKVRGYVSQVLNIEWLILEFEYEVGDRFIVKSTLQTGTVTSVSANKYTITALLDGETVETTYNQPLISKIPDI